MKLKQRYCKWIKEYHANSITTIKVGAVFKFKNRTTYGTYYSVVENLTNEIKSKIFLKNETNIYYKKFDVYFEEITRDVYEKYLIQNRFDL